MSSGKDDGTEFKGLNFGLGGLLKGLGDLIDLVHNMAEEGKDTYTKSGDILGNHNGRGVQGRYGITVRLGAGGDVKLDKFGNLNLREEGSNWDSVLEPVVDIYDEGDHLVVVAEVPGVTEEGITTDVEAGTLRLNAQGLQRQYRKVINLPADVETIPLATSYKNGILECKFTKLTAELRG